MNLHPAQIEIDISHKQKQPRYKSYAKIISIAINLGLSNFYFGYCLVYISAVSFTQIMTLFSITIGTNVAKGLLLGCLPIGAGIGALAGTKLIHVFSRRKLILLVNLVAIIAGSLLYINNFVLLLILRIIQGICVGLYTSIIPLYTTEISPVQIRSSTIPFTDIFSASGITFAFLFYFILNSAINHPDAQLIIWYLIIGFPLIPLIVQSIMLLFVFPYQTPKYHLLNHQKQKARDLIAQLYKPQYVEIVFHEKIQDIDFNKTKQAVRQSQQKFQGISAPTIRVASMSNAIPRIQMKQPDTPPLAIFCATHCMILRQFTGIFIFAAYGGFIVSLTDENLKLIAPCFLNFQVVVGATIAIWILHKIGKKTLLQIGTVILSLSLLLITIGFFILDSKHDTAFILVILGLIIVTFSFGVTYCTIWSYVTQIVEPSYAIYATMVTWIFASIVLILFPILTSAFNGNPAIIFLFFCAWVTVSFFVNQKIFVETKDRTVRQIKAQYLQIADHPCSCWKKPDCTVRAASMTQNQLFDSNNINLKLAELRRKRQNQKNIQLIKQNQQSMLRRSQQMDITIKKHNLDQTKHTLSSSTQYKKQQEHQKQLKRPPFLKQRKLSDSSEDVTRQQHLTSMIISINDFCNKEFSSFMILLLTTFIIFQRFLKKQQKYNNSFQIHLQSLQQNT